MIFEIRPAWRQGLRISRAILALALTGSCLGCYPPGPRELEDDDKPVVVSSNPPAVAGMSWPDHPDYPRLVFGFELQTDRMSRDLTMLLVHRSKRYTDAETYGAAMEKIAQVEQRVRDQSEWAALILRRELEEFGPEDAAAASDLIGLLGLVRSEDTAVEALHDFLMTDAPEVPGLSCNTRSCSSGDSPSGTARSRALNSLAKAAKKSEYASEVLLETARSADPVVREGVVRHYMNVRGSRMRAKSELRDRLPISEQHWLFHH